MEVVSLNIQAISTKLRTIIPSVFLVPDNYFVTSSKKLILCRKKKTEYNRDIPRTKQRIAIHLWCCDVAYFVLSCIVMQGK